MKWQLTPVFLPGKFCGQRNLAGCSLWGHKESDMTEHSLTHTCGLVNNRLSAASVMTKAV